MRMLATKIFAVAVSYLMLFIPLAQGANINIVLNGQSADSAILDTGNLISKQMNIVHDSSDFSWTNVRVSVNINGASLSHTIENVFVYICRLDSPVDCIREQPESFESFVDAELPWRDISERVGPGFYPEIANLMFLVKMRDSEGGVVWTGFFDTIERTAFNQFNSFNFDIQNMDFFVRSQDLISPAKDFIGNKFMIPFNWATNAVFSGANMIFGLGADTEEADQSPPGFVGILSSSNDISQISKDFFLIFPNTTSGIANSVTLNSNPLFSCGNNIAETSLGETSANCCFDVGCSQNQFCDLSDPTDPSSGICKDEGSISLSVISSPIVDVDVCGQEQDAIITIRINNPPSNIPDTLNSIIMVNNQAQNVECNLLSASDYTCPITVSPQAVCGTGSENIGGNSVSLTLSYNDGPNIITKDLYANMPDITVNFNCACEQGLFCDSFTRTCQSEDSVALKIINVTSFIEDFDPAGDFINIFARIDNAPSDLVVNNMVYRLGNITFDTSVITGASGSITCQETQSNVFACQIPLSVPNYDNRIFYVIRDNSLEFTVSFSNEPNPLVTKTLVSDFSDISIPSFFCGDGQITSGETSANCCFDVGCSQNQFCDLSDPTDPSSGICKDEGSISLSVISSPIVDVDVCGQEQDANIAVKIDNPPSELPDTVAGFILFDNEAQTVSCTRSGGSNYNCGINVLANAICGSGTQMINTSNLTFTFSYNDGAEIVSKDLSVDIPDIRVNYNCACEQNFFCDAASSACESQDAITLNIINVTSFIENYELGGDFIDIFARIDNAPSDLVVNSVNFELGNITFDSDFVNGQNGNIECQEFENRLFFCSIPFVIPNYNNTDFYVIESNSIEFSVSFSNEPNPSVTKTLVSDFSDISIPSFFCGDGVVNFGETPESCCIDAGCSSAGEFCDKISSCQPEGNINLNFVSAEPTNFTDCRESHDVTITSQVNNPPSDFTVEAFFFSSGGETKGWNLECEQTSPGSGNGIVECTLAIPPMESCHFPQETISGNQLNITIGFDNGTQDSPFFSNILKSLSAPLPDFSIAPVYNCGDGVPETDIGESAANCCIDVPCEIDPEFGENFYCDTSENNINGTCLNKNNIELVVTSPKNTVQFDSCEVSNDVTVKAFIKNQPSNMFLEEEFATFNGTTARDFFCKTEKRPGTKNVTFDCTLTVSSIDECSQGSAHTFADNSIHFLVSFENGVGETVTKELSAQLPEIKITQRVKTLFDIFDELGAKVEKSTKNVQNTAHDLLDFLKTCVDVSVILAIVGVAATIGGGIYAGVSQGSFQSVGQTFSGLGAASGSLMSAWTEFCRLVETQYQLAIKTEEIDIELAKLDTCLEVQQRQIDLGLCREQEQNCFNEIVDCVDFGRIERELRDIDSIVQASSDTAKRIGRDLADVGKGIEQADFLGIDRGTFRILWDGESTKNICEFDGRSTRSVSVIQSGVTLTTRECDNARLTFEFSGFERCDRLRGANKVYLRETNDVFDERDRPSVNNVFTQGYKNYEFVAFCDRDLDNRFSGSDTQIGTYQVSYVQGNNVTCKCNTGFSVIGTSQSGNQTANVTIPANKTIDTATLDNGSASPTGNNT